MYFPLKHLVDDPLFDDEQPYELFGAMLKPGAEPPPRFTNCSYHVQAGVNVTDVRSRKSGASLDEEGFTFLKHYTDCNLSAEHFEAGRGPPN
jgi:hypothetical protein